MKTTMDRILTVINVGGYTISEAMDSELYGISVVLDPPFIIKRRVYDSDLKVINKTPIYCTKKCVFYIDSDDPSKLHKFSGMKYLGLVDNPHYDNVGEKLCEFVKKFDGCLVYFNADVAILITKKNLFGLGCERGVRRVLERVLIQIKSSAGYPIRGMCIPAIFRIDASRIPDTWSFDSSYNSDVLSTFDILKDVVP